MGHSAIDFIKKLINVENVDVLNMEWASNGRDINIIEPVLCRLEKIGYKVHRTGYLFSLLKIVLLRPKMLLLSNNIGSIRNFYATKLAWQLGIKTVTLSSEGDYCVLDYESSIDSFFWGWDLNREFPVDLHLEWSSKNIGLINKYVKSADRLIERIKVSGATGFDRYKILNFKTKREFQAQYNMQRYKMIVGYAAWGFDLLYDEVYCQSSTFERNEDDNRFHKYNRDLLKDILKTIIKNNKDVLFILKRHPGELIYRETEIAGLENFDNVLIIKNEENIDDLINICDFWTAYESTTCLEAWLLGKQTVLINPVAFKEKRSEVALGSPVVTNADALQNIIDVGYVDGFCDMNDIRNNIIERIIEYSDGKNHVRATNYIVEEMNRVCNREAKLTLWGTKQLLKEICKAIIFYSPLRKFSFLGRLVKDCGEFERIYSVLERDVMVSRYRKAVENEI